jgi:hypothetical protein
MTFHVSPPFTDPSLSISCVPTLCRSLPVRNLLAHEVQRYIGSRNTTRQTLSKAYYQDFFWVLIDLVVELLGLIIKTFDNQTESRNPVSNDLIIKSFDTII